jgi:hypothetical protein
MRSKLALSVIVAASLVGTTMIASAQTQPAPGASSEESAPPATSGTKMKTKKVTSSKAKSGTTTGMSKNKSPTSDQGDMETGAGNNGTAK